MKPVLSSRSAGGQHALMEREDVIRTEYLKQKGLSVVRFTNLEVLKNLEGVVSVIIESLAARARHSPSPVRPGTLVTL